MSNCCGMTMGLGAVLPPSETPRETYMRPQPWVLTPLTLQDSSLNTVLFRPRVWVQKPGFSGTTKVSMAEVEKIDVQAQRSVVAGWREVLPEETASHQAFETSDRLRRGRACSKQETGKEGRLRGNCWLGMCQGGTWCWENHGRQSHRGKWTRLTREP